MVRAVEQPGAVAPPSARPSPGSAWLRRGLLVAAGLGLLAGVGVALMHLGQDPFVDARAYYDAGDRLNNGLPLYDPSAESSTGLYLYPPALAILWRPLALLPFEVAAAIWAVAMVASFGLAVRRIGVSERTLIAIGLLGLPIGWALSVGQVEPLLTLLLAAGSPWSIALAGHLKLLPWLAAAYWVVRRDRRALVVFGAWVIAVGVVQLVLEPEAMLAYLRLEWVGPAFNVRSFSPYAIHPLLWVALVAGLAGSLWYARRTKAAWPIAVALAVVTYPRLLSYQLMSLLAAFGGPREPARPVEHGNE